jgi:hypothetical protein
MEQIATAAVSSYLGGKATNIAQGEITTAIEPTQGAYLPTATDSLLVKAASTAIGADVGATTAALATGKPLDQALEIGSKAAVTSLATSAGQAVGSEVASNIEDPTLAKIASKASGAATTAGLTGGDVGKSATGAVQQDVLNAAGDVVGKNLPDLSGAGNVDLSGIKEAIKPISDVATSIAQPISDVATKVLQPLEQPIKDVGTSIAGAAKDITSDLPNVSIPKIDKDVMKAISDQYGSKPQVTSDLTSPSIATTGSPASYAGEDIAILGDTPGSLGSKVNKKGGKYPWGDPEGTTALKEGLGV